MSNIAFAIFIRNLTRHQAWLNESFCLEMFEIDKYEFINVRIIFSCITQSCVIQGGASLQLSLCNFTDYFLLQTIISIRSVMI